MDADPAGAAPVERLRPIRVLLVGRDRRFLRMADILFTRHGWEVTRIERSSELLDRVRSHRPNVVVLDGTDSLSATARTVSALESLPAPVHPLVVYEGAEDDALRSLRLLPKWGSFEEIVGEVERLYEGRPAAIETAQEPLS